VNASVVDEHSGFICTVQMALFMAWDDRRQQLGFMSLLFDKLKRYNFCVRIKEEIVSLEYVIEGF
jgi:hypothetical protein